MHICVLFKIAKKKEMGRQNEERNKTKHNLKIQYRKNGTKFCSVKTTKCAMCSSGR